MAISKADIEVLAAGMAPAIDQRIRDSIQPLADLIVDQGKTIKQLEQRLEAAEGRDHDADAQRSIEGGR